MKEGAAVIKFKADGTYDTLKPGTNRLVCYDRSGEPGHQPFAVQCTSVANLPRVAQNRKFEAIPDKAARQAALDAAEKGYPRKAGVWLGVADDECCRPGTRDARSHDRRGAGRDHPVDGPSQRQPRKAACGS